MISSVTFAHLSQGTFEEELINRPELYIRWCDPDGGDAIGNINCEHYKRFFERSLIE